MSLRGQAIGGIIWTVADTFVLRGLSFFATIILARWLGPEEFGLVGMISVFIAIGTSLTDSGLSASLIRTKNANEEDFSTVFILNLWLSFLVYVILFFAAPWIADFFDQPVLVDIVRVYCLSFVISAFSAVQLARLNAQLKFKKIAKLNIPGTIIGVAVGLILGYLGYGAWSIVAMYLTTQFVQSISLWLSSSWRPTLRYTRNRAKYHYGFGYKLMLSSLIDVVFKNIYNVLIGKFYSLQTLGYYERSKTFNNYPVTILTSVVSKVTYPLLANIQGDKERISSVYRKILRMTFFLTAPMMLIASAIAEPLFKLVLGDEWMAGVPFFQILCLSSMFYPIQAFNLNVFKVYGRSDLFLKLEIIKKSVIVICILITFNFGVYGLVWSSVITSYIALLINTHYSADLIGYSGKQQFREMLPTFLMSFVSAAGIYAYYRFFPDLSDLWKVIVGCFLGTGIYLGLNYMFKTDPLNYTIALIKNRFR